jgi:hypothetical protein
MREPRTCKAPRLKNKTDAGILKTALEFLRGEEQDAEVRRRIRAIEIQLGIIKPAIVGEGVRPITSAPSAVRYVTRPAQPSIVTAEPITASKPCKVEKPASVATATRRRVWTADQKSAHRKRVQENYLARKERLGEEGMRKRWREQHAANAEQRNERQRRAYKAEMESLSPADREVLRLQWRVKAQLQAERRRAARAAAATAREANQGSNAAPGAVVSPAPPLALAASAYPGLDRSPLRIRHGLNLVIGAS